MSPIKSMFILYLIISSFELSVCTNNENGEKESEKFDFVKIPKVILEKIKKAGIDIVQAYDVDSILKGINAIIITIGHGIAYASSAIYSSLLETLGEKVAGLAVLSTFLVILIGQIFIVYEIVNYIKNFRLRLSCKSD